jgi:hypothetical protein
MTNQIPAMVDGKLTTPFKLVHCNPPNTCTWFPLFFIVCFYKDPDKDKYFTSFRSKAMIGIIVS